MTVDNLLTRGRAFVQAFTSEIISHVRNSR
jgi:hypothetical protein